MLSLTFKTVMDNPARNTPEIRRPIISVSENHPLQYGPGANIKGIYLRTAASTRKTPINSDP